VGGLGVDGRQEQLNPGNRVAGGLDHPGGDDESSHVASDGASRRRIQLAARSRSGMAPGALFRTADLSINHSAPEPASLKTTPGA
jgi:hypothetical protein